MEAFEEGYQAGLRGDDPRLCPYDKLSREWHDWHRAHMLVVRTLSDDDVADAAAEIEQAQK